MHSSHHMRVYLIGFMGSGKTHVGRQLAAFAQMPFVDLDDLIVQQQQHTIIELFERSGESAFRQMEQAALHTTAEYAQAIIACGGGTPCFFDNMDWMNRHGITIFLDVPASILAQRLYGEMAQRPLLRGLDKDALQSWIEEKQAQRLPFYQQASVIYQVQSNQEHVSEALWQHFQHITGH